MNKHITKICNVLVIGSGGAGLRAAIEAKFSGLDVHVLGKRSKHDPHTILAAGGINASFGNIDKDDNWLQHFADTYIEGYGIGDPNIIEKMSKESPKLVTEIDEWGANFAKLKDGKLDQRYFGAHTYRRTCYSGDFTGKSIMNALLKKSTSLNIPIDDCQYVTDLLVSENCCFGAMSFNINNGKRTLFLADATIIATGGHTRIWKKSSSRRDENNGDGLNLALKAGAKLIDMEMVQFHPTGIIFPENIAGTLVTEAVRGEGGLLLNGKGERFMSKYDPERMELSTRDKVAIANYTEIIEGRTSPNGGVYLDISHKEKDNIIKKLPQIYRFFIEEQMLDITKKPMEVSPTAHYSMGGIAVSDKDHSTGVNGLFACGEVAGGLHGANRLGGNSLAEILVFGKQTGQSAVEYSKDLSNHLRSNDSINEAHKNINKHLKKGNQIAREIEHKIRDTMWKNCGVVREEKSLNNAIENINKLSELATDIDVRVDSGDYHDLILAFNVESSLITAKATILSALARKESIGSHQRKDFPHNNNNNNQVNYLIYKGKDDLKLIIRKVKEVKEDLKLVINRTDKKIDLQGKLIE